MLDAVTTFADSLEPGQLFFVRVLVSAVFLLAAFYGQRAIHIAVTAYARRVKLRLPEKLQRVLQGFTEPVELLFRLLFFYMGALVIPLPDAWTRLLWRILTPLTKALAVMLVSWGFLRAAPLYSRLLRGAQDSLDIHGNRTIERFFENIYRVLVASFAMMTVLDIFGVPVASLVAGAGLVGLAISLAAQSTLANLIAGITLVIERPFSIGDFIMLGEFFGTVEDISFRSTRIRTPDNVLITVENSKVCSEYIQNGTTRDSRLWTFTLRLPYETSCAEIDKLRDEIRALFVNDPGIKDDPLVVTVDSIGEDGVKLLVRVYSTTADYMEYLYICDRLNRQILALLEREGCTPVYPTASVYIKDEPGASA